MKWRQKTATIPIETRPNTVPTEEEQSVERERFAFWHRFCENKTAVVGLVVLVLLISARNEPITSRVIYKINEGALCGQTGLEAGDKVLAVNGRRCFVANDMIYELVRAEQYRADFTVLRDGQRLELTGVARRWNCRMSSLIPGWMTPARPI